MIDVWAEHYPSWVTVLQLIRTLEIMVQLFYYENRGKCCRKVFNYEGFPTKVLLFPYEGWAQPAMITYWLLKTYWWSRARCKIVEVNGNRKLTTKAKMVDKGNGNMYIYGTFKDLPHNPDFKVNLTTNVSNADFQLGYSVTGTLERGDKRKGDLQLTHYAMIKRRGYWHDLPEDSAKSGHLYPCFCFRRRWRHVYGESTLENDFRIVHQTA